MDICSRALNFHHYQLSQEAVYQKLLYKRSQDRAQSYSKQYENLCREAEAEVSILNEKLAQLDIELQQERAKVRDLQEARKESSRHAAKLKAQHGPAFLRPTTPDMEELASIEAIDAQPLPTFNQATPRAFSAAPRGFAQFGQTHGQEATPRRSAMPSFTPRPDTSRLPTPQPTSRRTVVPSALPLLSALLTHRMGRTDSFAKAFQQASSFTPR
jgi:hypothetical protein